MNQTLKDNIKALIPMNTIRNLRAVRNARSIRHMADIPRIPFDKTAYPEGINMIGCFTQDSGLGESCRIVAKDIEAAGIPHHFIDLSKYEWVGPDHTFDAQLMDITDTDAFYYGINLWHVNMHLFKKAWELTRDQWDRHYNIAFWSWENETFPEEWVPMLHMVDEIWTPSQFISEAIRKVTDKPVVTLPHVIEVHPKDGIGRDYFRLPSDQFLYLMLYDANSISDRKNPDEVIEAFKQAFPLSGDTKKQDNYKLDVEESAKDYSGKENYTTKHSGNRETIKDIVPITHDFDRVGLVIKISHGSEIVLKHLKDQLAGYNVYFVKEMLPKSYVDALIRCCDVYVSLHRAEGFGLVLGEAMALGVPTVATDYSGNLEFQNENNTCLVAAKRVPVGKDVWPYRKNYVWAEPDTDDAAIKLRALFEDRALYDRIRDNGVETIRTVLTRERMAEIVKKRFEDIYG